MPQKYQPDFTFLRHVTIKRVHLFTFLQVCCLVVLMVIKQIKAISIVFPLMILGTCFVRMMMDKIFEQRELKWLDDIMPEDKKRMKEDKEKLAQDEAEAENLLDDDYRLNEVKVQNEKYREIDDRVNITEEVNKTSIWLQVRRDSVPVIENGTNALHNRKNKSRPKSKESKEKENDVARNEKAAFYFGDDDLKEAPEAEDRESKI